MRTRSSLERLAAAGRPLVGQAHTLVDGAEENRVLERIVSVDRSPAARRRPRRLVLALAAVAVLAAAGTVAGIELDHGATPATRQHGPGPVALLLTGARLEMAGYHFRTPAGFKASKTSCDTASSGSGPAAITKSGPVTPVNGMQAAASADGGCVEAFFEIPGSSGAPAPIPSDAVAVDVGAYQGYFDAQGSSGDVLYVQLPKTADGSSASPVYLVLYAQGLTEDQLVAVAQSGLPGSP
ncbi:MAG TPA: hypothetical protein VFA37_03620 [Gaiellaceae bacterium]|nr:hypothetical protein [Gaiellaceae bacterium]